MLMSHSSTKQTDTIFLSNVRYDSVYVSHDSRWEYHRAQPPNSYRSDSVSSSLSSVDTVVITKVETEYRYQVIRDTIERVKIETVRDSIPYEVRITEVKEVPRRRTWFDKLCYCCFGILILLLGFKLFKSSPRLF